MYTYIRPAQGFGRIPVDFDNDNRLVPVCRNWFGFWRRTSYANATHLVNINNGSIVHYGPMPIR